MHEQVSERYDQRFYDGMFVGDFKSVLEREVSRILAITDDQGIIPTIEQRKTIINVLFDAYIDQTGERPDGVQVQRLANWLLFEYLTDRHPDKVARNDYPIMTKRQLRTRYRRERADDSIPDHLTENNYLEGRKQPIYTKSE